MKISSRSRAAPFHAMDVLAEAAALEASGRDIVHMEIGEPAVGAPRAARERLAAAMEAGAGMGYTDGLGRRDLRDAIAALYARRHGLEVDPGRVIVTAGSSAAFTLAFLTLFEAGERVALGDPGYPCYRNILHVLGLAPVGVATTPDTRFQPTPELLAAAGPSQGLLVASPANPTGTMLDRAALSALVAHCADRGMALISDEIYHGLEFAGPAVSALELTDDAIVINSFSKYHAMTGWRVGWMVVPETLVRPMQTLAQNMFICASHAGQIAALGALSPEGEAELASHLERYRTNRDTVTTGLARLGFADIAPPDGAFYAYAGLGDIADDSTVFCRELLQHEGVATTPGRDFDPARGHATLRLSFAQSPERVEEGMHRLARFLGAGAG